MLQHTPPHNDFSNIFCRNTEPHHIPQNSTKDVFDLPPAELVDMALHHLQKAGVQLMEWRSLLYRRMNVPLIIKDFSYVVSDDDLDGASDILGKIGLPLSPHSRLLTRAEGAIHSKGRFHRLTRSSAQAWVQHFVLYPTSFATITVEECTEESPIHLSPSPPVLCTTILVPRPSAVYAFILRTMLKYPNFCSTRTILASDLSELIDYHLLDLQDGYVDSDDQERWEELEVDKRIDNAVRLIRQWGRKGEWRDGEDWFEDALAAVISGAGQIVHLPALT